MPFTRDALRPAAQPEAVVKVEVRPGDVSTHVEMAAGARVPEDVRTTASRLVLFYQILNLSEKYNK